MAVAGGRASRCPKVSSSHVRCSSVNGVGGSPPVAIGEIYISAERVIVKGKRGRGAEAGSGVRIEVRRV